VKRLSISNVCEWVKNSWQRVKSETIVKSLNKSDISNALDGSEDDILYEETDASSENNHEDDFNGSDDDFWVSLMNKLYYGCYLWYVTILFSSNKLLKLKYIHHYFF